MKSTPTDTAMMREIRSEKDAKSAIAKRAEGRILPATMTFDHGSKVLLKKLDKTRRGFC